MDYQFNDFYYTSDRIVFAVVLDKQKMKERILVGTDFSIQKKLRGEKCQGIYYDVTRPLGTLVIDFYSDLERKWNTDVIMELREALSLSGKKRTLCENKPMNFLAAQYESNIPERMFAAIKIWNGYQLVKNTKRRDELVDMFLGDIEKLVNAFHREKMFKIDLKEGISKDYDLSKHFYSNLLPKEQTVEVWYPDRMMKQECALIEKSFYPIIIYYLNKLNEWGLYFRHCKVCGTVFIAENNKFNICSAECKKIQNTVNKNKYSDNAKKNEYDRVRKNEEERWRNKIKSVKAKGLKDEVIINQLEDAFLEFKETARVNRNKVKNNQMTPKEYMDWIIKNSVDMFCSGK